MTGRRRDRASSKRLIGASVDAASSRSAACTEAVPTASWVCCCRVRASATCRRRSRSRMSRGCRACTSICPGSSSATGGSIDASAVPGMSSRSSSTSSNASAAVDDVVSGLSRSWSAKSASPAAASVSAARARWAASEREQAASFAVSSRAVENWARSACKWEVVRPCSSVSPSSRRLYLRHRVDKKAAGVILCEPNLPRHPMRRQPRGRPTRGCLGAAPVRPRRAVSAGGRLAPPSAPEPATPHASRMCVGSCLTVPRRG